MIEATYFFMDQDQAKRYEHTLKHIKKYASPFPFFEILLSHMSLGVVLVTWATT
jgi:hypothetical protein